MKRKNRNRSIVIISIILLAIAGVVWTVTFLRDNVTDFASCVESDGTIQEVFPRRCLYGDETYTETIENPDDFVDLTLPEDERDFINAWITANELNQYGDPLDTVYAGGTPLFDETTGETTPLYEYLVFNYPDKPWIVVAQEPGQPIQQEPVIEAPSNPPESEGPLSFTDVKAWGVYNHPNFTIDYPDFSSVTNGPDFPIRITSANDFSFSIYAPTEPTGEGTCIQSIELGVDGYVYLCHNNNQRYISIYQRMIDSIIPR